MKLSYSSSSSFLALAFTITSSNGAFLHPSSSTTTSSSSSISKTIIKGYLDDLTNELYKEVDMADEVADSRENNQMSKDQIDRFGPGNLADYVEFNEFDGGDGQMGVAG